MNVLDRLTGGPDPERVRDELIAMKEPERRQRARAAEREFRAFAWRPRPSGESPSRRWRATAIGWVGTATARKLVSEFWRVGFELDNNPDVADDVYAVLAARGRAFFETFARGLLRSEGAWGSWPIVRRAVRERLIEQPAGDEYLRRMVFGVSAGAGFEDVDTAYKGLLADPSLLEREVWELFEVDAAGELANANTWQPKDPAEPDGVHGAGENRWLYAFTRLAEEGRLDRGRLLDASLDALMRDFRASTVGWYAKLHEELQPTRDERLERLDRYLALVTSPAPAVVKEGIAALREVEDALDPAAVARVAPTPFTQRQKNLSTETLSLLARLCKRHPDHRSVLLDAAAHALGHERADVQERALKLLEQYPDDVARASLLAYVEAVSPTLRPRVEALTGVAAPEGEEPAGEIEIRAPVQPRPTPEVVREARTPLRPVESVDELIELAAGLVEGQGDGDDCERFLDGVSRLCGERRPGFDRRTAGLAKRADEVRRMGAQATGTEVVAYVVEAWVRRRHPRATLTSSRTILGFLARRAEEVARRVARGRARPLLALPTHDGGWIDPDVLEERVRRTGRLLNRPEPLDELQARVRAFPDVGPLVYERRVETKTQWGQTTRWLDLVSSTVPPELGELGPIAATTGGVESMRTAWYGTGWAGFDALGVRWALTVLPSLPEAAFAGAAKAAVEAADGAAYYHPDAVLEHALDPGVPLGGEAWFAVAACLVAKSPDLPRVAADLLVQSVEDGRFDAGALGESLAWLLSRDFAKANRLAAPLRDVARVSSLHAAQVLRLVEAVLAGLATPPNGLHGLLEVGVECATATGRRLDDRRARAALEQFAGEVSASSKLGRLAHALLAA